MTIIGQGEESISLVEELCRLVDGIDFHRSNPNLRGEIFSPSECIDQQELSQFLSLHGSIHRQSSDQHDGHVDLRQPLRLICGQGVIDDGVVGEGVTYKNTGELTGMITTKIVLYCGRCRLCVSW